MTIQTNIHPSAVVEAGAQIGTGARIGPFCHIGADAVVGDNVELVGHVSVQGATTIGAGTKVWPMTVLGAPPQNTKHKGGRTTLVINFGGNLRGGFRARRSREQAAGGVWY